MRTRPCLAILLTVLLVVAGWLYFGGCGPAPAPVPTLLPMAGPTSRPTFTPYLPPTAAAYPPPPTVATIPPATAAPIRTPAPPSPTSTPIHPTPYAPKEGLPANLPSVVYAVQRPDQPVQLWRLRYDQGVLQEEIWIDLAPAALEAKMGPGHWTLGYMWADRLIPSPDGRSLAFILRSREGGGAQTLVIGQDGTMNLLVIGPARLGVGLLAWMPNSAEALMGDPDGNVWGIVRTDGTNATDLRVDASGPLLDAVALPDGKAVIFSQIPQDGIWMGSIDVGSGRLTSFSMPAILPGSQVRNLALSPDGQTCALIWEHKVVFRGAGQIWLMDANGSNQYPLGPADTYDIELAWSPDGKTLAFVRWENTQTWIADHDPTTWTAMVSSLWLIDAGAGRERMLLSSEDRYAHWSPVWLPGGSGLLFLSTRGGETNLWLIRPDGSGLQQLTYQGSLSGEVAIFAR